MYCNSTTWCDSIPKWLSYSEIYTNFQNVISIFKFVINLLNKSFPGVKKGREKVRGGKKLAGNKLGSGKKGRERN